MKRDEFARHVSKGLRALRRLEHFADDVLAERAVAFN
jgi:hypothetical protein